MAMQISPQNVVGRDRLIEQIWKKLESKSLRFTAERRIGKTTVMKKMLAEPKAWNLVVVPGSGESRIAAEVHGGAAERNEAVAFDTAEGSQLV